MKRYDILTVADICVDVILNGNVIPEFGQIEKNVDSFALELGGSACIFASQFSKLGGRIGLLGTVGKDTFGDVVRSKLSNAGVDISLLKTSPGIDTGCGVSLVDGTDRAILTYQGTIDATTRRDLFPELSSMTAHWHIASYYLLKNLFSYWPTWIKTLKESGVTVSIDTNWDPAQTWKGIVELLPLVDVFLPNVSEAKAITGKKDIIQAGRHLASFGPLVVIKNGKDGAIAFSGDNIKSFDTPPELKSLPVKDTVGAGDSFDAGFLRGWLLNMDLDKCLELGIRCGSANITDKGGIAGQLIEKVDTRHPLRALVEDRKNGVNAGIFSICSSNKYVIESAMINALKERKHVLIESTSNQVNQEGGYTGMTPVDFAKFIYEIALKLKIPQDKIILGGDHLGPNPWKNEPTTSAMKKACKMVKAYVEAGFVKIHLDASMRLADDPGDENTPLSEETVAERAAVLCEAAEKAADAANLKIRPFYVIGTEVPIPGGSNEEEHSISVTMPERALATINMTKEAFKKKGLVVWNRVIALVVQPGVEFGGRNVFDFDASKVDSLSKVVDDYDNLVFEVHSTDYQTEKALEELVKNNFAILKVGPWLTFAFREAIFCLSSIEQEWLTDENCHLSGLKNILDENMVRYPDNWKQHYHGSDKKLKYARKYSYSDRSRYYWPRKEVDSSLQQLINNLESNPPPLTLLSQYMPNQYRKIRDGKLNNDPVSLIHDKIIEVIALYSNACNAETLSEIRN